MSEYGFGLPSSGTISASMINEELWRENHMYFSMDEHRYYNGRLHMPNYYYGYPSISFSSFYAAHRPFLGWPDDWNI